MTPRELADLALGLPEAVEDEPFGPDVLVYKVAEKIFAIVQEGSPGRPGQVTLKCDPALALHLREQYPAVVPGYHMNKRHWNTVIIDGTVPPGEVREMVEHSYQQVVNGLPRAVRVRLLRPGAQTADE